MTHQYRRLIGLLALLVLPGSAAIAQAGRFDLAKTKAVLTPIIEKTLAENGIPSMSIALVRGDSIVWTAAFGYSNMYTHARATTETLYSTGSSFKSVTATAVMQLVQQGKIRLDAPINLYLGDHPVQDRLQSEKQVTVTDMLSHWSGLIAGAEVEPIWGRKLPETLNQMASKLYTIRPPETKWEYNNYGYGLAGLIVQNASGIDYETYMVDSVLRPLGVTTPHPVYPTPGMVERMALPYKAGGSLGKPVPEVQVHFDVYPAGDIYLRAEDMARYLGAQINGGDFNGHRMLSAASVHAMQIPRFGGTYGFGFWSTVDSTTGDTLIYHGGAIEGQRAFLIGDVNAHVGVYYMTNSDYLPDAVPPAQSDIVYAALRLLRGQNYVPRPERKGITVGEKVLNSYVGTYDLGRGSIVISRVGRSLGIQENGQPAINELFAETPTRFFQRGSTATITFEGDGGNINRLVVEAGSQHVTAMRHK
ncbi:MAG: serine hydrolase domain-containing protein [Gemmatimonadaceae bacterium]